MRIRLRWFEPEPCESAAWTWRDAAPYTATLFLTPLFWFLHPRGITMYWSILPFALMLAAGSIALGALFFWIPTAATQRSALPLHRILESATGTIPAAILRLCAISFVVLWLAGAAGIPGWSAPLILRRQPVAPYLEVGLINAAILLLTLATTLRSSAGTVAKLSRFSGKLGLAILIAALIRVRDGWPQAMLGFLERVDLDISPFSYVWQDLSALLFHLIPLGLLTGAALGRRLVPGRNRQPAMTACFGFVLPLFVATLLTGLIVLATARSSFYQPSLFPTVHMALWSRASERAIPGSLLLVLVAMLGTFRLGIRLLAEAIGKPDSQWRPLAALSLVIAALSTVRHDLMEVALRACGAGLICAAGILTAEFLVAAPRTSAPSRVDLASTVALLSGLAICVSWNALTGSTHWTPTWPLPAYATSFAVCLIARRAGGGSGASA